MKLSEDRTNFLGIPVSGEINEGSTFVNQKTKEDLAPILQAVLDDPLITEFGWTQYTPYFNDGDVCEFSVNEPWFRTTSDARWGADIYPLLTSAKENLVEALQSLEQKDYETVLDLYHRANQTFLKTAKIVETFREKEDGDNYNLTVDNHPVLGEQHWKNGRYEKNDRTPEVIAAAEKCYELSRAVQSGEFDLVLTEAFGDHCAVTIRRDGITIRGYQHD